MRKKTEDTGEMVTLTIDDETSIIVGEVKYSGTVTVDAATAEALTKTGKVKDHVESTDA